MRFAGGHPDAAAGGLIASPPHARHGEHRRPKVLLAVVGIASASLLSSLFPPTLTPWALDLICWILVGAMAVALLVAGAEVLDRLLDV